MAGITQFNFRSASQALQANEDLREQYKDMPEIINKITININSCLRESLHLLVRYCGPIWNELYVSFVQGKIDLPDSDSGYESKQCYRYYPVKTAQQQVIGWGVAVDENFVIFQISPDYPGPQDEILAFSKKLVKAIAYHDIKMLNKVFDFLQDVEWHSSIFDETEKVIRDQLGKHFSRIIVRGLLINNGKTSYAVSGNPKMRLYVGGFPYEIRETGHHESLQKDIELRMRCVKDDYLQSVPTLTVNPGTAEPFLAVSEEYLRDMMDCEAIRAAFASERQCQLEFELTERPKSISSRKSPVRTARIGSGEYQVLPRKPSKLEQLLSILK